MNPSRRSFLSALVAAPVAAPAIVAEAAKGYASGGWIGGAAPVFTLGEMSVGESLVTSGQMHALRYIGKRTETPDGIHFEDVAVHVEAASVEEAISKMDNVIERQARMSPVNRFPDSNDLGAPHVPFSTDECRCPGCQLPSVEAPPLVPDARPGYDPRCCHKTVVQRCSGCPYDALASVDSANRDMARAAAEAGYVPLREYVAEYTPLTAAEIATPLSPSNPFRAGRVRPAPRRIIAMTGLAGSGKSTAALHLVKYHGWHRVRFAGPLKAMMAALGLSEREIDGDLKEQPCALLGGCTPRHAMQTLGTEWGRDIIDPSLWIRAWQHALAQVPADVNVVVDDCRFPNEAYAVRLAGGIIVRVEREGAGQSAAGHSSEGYRVDTGPCLENNGSVQDFLCLVDDLVTP
jgi:hypothetical protein